MVENINIRPAKDEDVEVVYKFICLLTEQHLDFKIFKKYYTSNIASDLNIYLIADEKSSGTPVGFLSCQGQVLLHHNGKVFEIQELYVDEQFRSKGVGRLLLGALDDRLKNTSYDSLELSSSIRRVDAHRFYLRYGFSQSHLKFTRKGTISSLGQQGS